MKNDKKSLLDNNIIKNVFKYLPNYVFYKDKNFIYRLCNDQFIKYAGLKSHDDVIGKTDFEMPWGETTAKLYREEDIQIIETGRSILSKEVQMETPHLGDRILLVSKRALCDKNNSIVGILGIYIDITERKKQESLVKESLEKAEKISKAKSEFIANMSHDIRTPITGMLGMIQEIINSTAQAQFSLNDKKGVHNLNLLKNFIATVQSDSHLLMEATNELLQLCNEILEVVSIDSGKLENNVESFNIDELIAHNIKLLQPVARQKKLDLLYKIDRQVPRYLSGFRIYLDRVLLNLISNALKFTEKGRVKVSVTALDKKSDATIQWVDTTRIQILIKDTGIGIPQDKFDVIFENFSRLTPTYKGLYKGAGLGLYIVKHYVEAMQGTIEVSSQMGKGTCFTLTLPFITSNHTDRPRQSVYFPVTIEPVTMAANKKTLKTQKPISIQNTIPTILIVEDNTLAAVAVKLTLKLFNCRVEIAENGNKAVLMAQNHFYDLILMDIGLPDFSGIEATKKIRAFNDSKKSQVPIIALTGHADSPDLRQEALEAGMQEVLTKPAESLALESILKKYIFEPL